MINKQKSVFLDVDSSIVENNLRFAKNEEEEQFQQFFGNNKQMPSRLVTPTPGFCVKTKEVGTEVKVFVNICQTDAIPAPKDITEAELSEILEDDLPDFRVPMSIGDKRTDKDKQGCNAQVIDIAINPAFFRKVDTVKLFKEFLMAVVFEGIKHKYGLVCVDEKIILKNRKAFGNLQTHRIEQREIQDKLSEGSVNQNVSPLNELSGGKNPEQRKVMIETISDGNNKLREPAYRLYKRKSGQNCLIGEFKLPDVMSAKEITLDLGEDRILLEAKSRSYLLDIFVPYVIRQDKCSSVFEKSSKVLTVIMPLMGG